MYRCFAQRNNFPPLTDEKTSYETLIQRFEHPVFNIISRLIDDQSDAADVMQRVFQKVYRNVGNSRGDHTLRIRIYRIAVSEARNYRKWFRWRRRQEVGLDRRPDGYEDSRLDTNQSPVEVIVDAGIQALIEEALSKMNPKLRAALVLREIEGLGYEEISDILDASLATVKSRILRGRDALRKHLAGRLNSSSTLDWSAELSD
jgi:RNA polymerase sigma-70 factor (ECF subfamily)